MKRIAHVLNEIFLAEEDLHTSGCLVVNEVDPSKLLDSAEGHIRRAHAALNECGSILDRLPTKEQNENGKTTETRVHPDAQL